MSEVVSYPLATIAKVLDVDERRVQQLAKEGVIPKPVARGRYALVPSVHGYIRYLRERSLTPDKVGAGDLAINRARLAAAAASTAELDLSERKGQLIPAEIIFQFVGDVFSLVKAQIEGSALSPGEQRQILTQLVRLKDHPDFQPSSGADVVKTDGI